MRILIEIVIVAVGVATATPKSIQSHRIINREFLDSQILVLIWNVKFLTADLAQSDTRDPNWELVIEWVS